MYGCSREEAVFIIVGRGGDLFIFEFVAENVKSDFSNHETTSLDVMTAKAKIFGFLADKKKYWLLKPTHI